MVLKHWTFTNNHFKTRSNFLNFWAGNHLQLGSRSEGWLTPLKPVPPCQNLYGQRTFYILTLNYDISSCDLIVISLVQVRLMVKTYHKPRQSLQ